jgi:vacuolar-type H+-ATPase subunit H
MSTTERRFFMDHPIISAITEEEAKADRQIAAARKKAALLVTEARNDAILREQEATVEAEKLIADAGVRAREKAAATTEEERAATEEAVRRLKNAAQPRMYQAAAAVVEYLKQ